MSNSDVTRPAAVLEMIGPLTVKEVEGHVFHAARSDPHFEAGQRTWLEADRSYFIRWSGASDGQPIIIGLGFVYQLPEMASEIRFVPFDPEAPQPEQDALTTYVNLLKAELEPQGFM